MHGRDGAVWWSSRRGSSGPARLSWAARLDVGAANDAAGEHDVVVVEHDRLARRDGTLRLVEDHAHDALALVRQRLERRRRLAHAVPDPGAAANTPGERRQRNQVQIL